MCARRSRASIAGPHPVQPGRHHQERQGLPRRGAIIARLFWGTPRATHRVRLALAAPGRRWQHAGMRIVSHTASNTEIVCALGMGAALVGIDADSDHPPDIVEPLPKLGRDLQFDTGAVAALAPDVVLSSLTVPGHETVVAGLRTLGVPVHVADPVSLADVFADIRTIAGLLGVPERGEALVADMTAAMPDRTDPDGPRIAVEWWPKPVIVAAGRSWVSDVVALAGGRNPWADSDEKSVTVEPAAAERCAPDIVVMSWCGVAEANYRADKVLERPGWASVPAIAAGRVHAITEAHLGRPGPRLVDGYRRIAELVRSVAATPR